MEGNKRSKTITTIVLLIEFFMLFFHHGIGRLEKTWHYKSGFYITLTNGRTFEASRCKKGVDLSLGKHIEFTAIGVSLSLGDQIFLKPAIIQCRTW